MANHSKYHIIRQSERTCCRCDRYRRQSSVWWLESRLLWTSSRHSATNTSSPGPV